MQETNAAYMQDHIKELRPLVGREYRAYVNKAVRQDHRQKAPALVERKRKDKADCDSEDHLVERFDQILPGEQIQNMSEPERDGRNDDSRFGVAVFKHSLEQEAPEDQFLCKSDHGHRYGGINQTRHRVIRPKSAEEIQAG